MLHAPAKARTSVLVAIRESVREGVFIAVTLLAVDTFVYFGLFYLLALPAGLLLLLRGLWLVWNRELARAFGSFAVLGLVGGLFWVQPMIHQWQIDRAKALAVPVIDAVDRYRRDHGRWPADERDLVPAYLEDMPDCLLRLWYAEWRYEHTRRTPYLRCPVMPPFGRLIYRLESRSWSYIG